jgi:hypothetical protein
MAGKTVKQQAKLIIDELEDRLPAALTAASLDDFQDYIQGTPNDQDRRQICCYYAFGSHTGDQRSRSFVIDIQLPGVLDYESNYLTAISEVIEQYITADLVQMVDRDEIQEQQFPIEPGDGSTFVLYVVRFSEDLDDCDY